MNIQKFREVIKRRETCHYEYDAGIEACNKEEIALLIEDIPSTIKFLEEDCTESEYSWISEVIEDIAAQTGSRKLIECYKKLMRKYPTESKKYNIAGSIKSAEEALLETNDEKNQ